MAGILARILARILALFLVYLMLNSFVCSATHANRGWQRGGGGGIVIPFHAQILTKFTSHVLNQSLSEKLQGNEIFTTKH